MGRLEGVKYLPLGGGWENEGYANPYARLPRGVIILREINQRHAKGRRMKR